MSHADDRPETTDAATTNAASTPDASSLAEAGGVENAEANQADEPKHADTHAPEHAPEHAPRCANCDAPLVGRYCWACGQRVADRVVPLRELGREVIDDVLGLDLRLARTLPPLLVRPGRVMVDYLAGRRERYVKPVRLLLLTGFAFLLVLGLYARVSPGTGIVTVSEPEELEAELDSLAQAETFAGRAEYVLGRGALKAVREPARFEAELVGQLTGLAVVLLPVFALLLKALYVRRGRLYAEHLLFAAHVHAFAFLLLAVLVAARLALTGGGPPADPPVGYYASAALFAFGLLVVLPAYLFRAMRRVYEQGALKTLVKLALLLGLYVVVGAMAFALYLILILALL